MTRTNGRPDGRTAARLLIVDDHDLARAGLRSMLSDERSLEVVAEATSGQQAVALCQRLQPDLVLMDVRMPDLDGLAATSAIKATCPATSVVMVTMHENVDYLLEALKAGAAGYVLKSATRREVIDTIRQVLRGESALQPGLAAQLLQRFAVEPTRPTSAVERLTPREREVLALIVQGRTNQQIGGALMLSLSTVKTHVEHIIAKLGVSDRTQAAVRAIAAGFSP